MGSKLAGILRQLALLVVTIVTILIYLTISWVKVGFATIIRAVLS